MISAQTCPGQQRVRFLIANVLQENRSSARLLQVAEDTDPDIILLTEIDEWWAREVEGPGSRRLRTLLEPRSNTVRIGLYSRLLLTGGEVRYPIAARPRGILSVGRPPLVTTPRRRYRRT